MGNGKSKTCDSCNAMKKESEVLAQVKKWFSRQDSEVRAQIKEWFSRHDDMSGDEYPLNSDLCSHDDVSVCWSEDYNTYDRGYGSREEEVPWYLEKRVHRPHHTGPTPPIHREYMVYYLGADNETPRPRRVRRRAYSESMFDTLKAHSAQVEENTGFKSSVKCRFCGHEVARNGTLEEVVSDNWNSAGTCGMSAEENVQMVRRSSLPVRKLGFRCPNCRSVNLAAESGLRQSRSEPSLAECANYPLPADRSQLFREFRADKDDSKEEKKEEGKAKREMKEKAKKGKTQKSDQTEKKDKTGRKYRTVGVLSQGLGTAFAGAFASDHDKRVESRIVEEVVTKETESSGNVADLGTPESLPLIVQKPKKVGDQPTASGYSFTASGQSRPAFHYSSGDSDKPVTEGSSTVWFDKGARPKIVLRRSNAMEYWLESSSSSKESSPSVRPKTRRGRVKDPIKYSFEGVPESAVKVGHGRGDMSAIRHLKVGATPEGSQSDDQDKFDHHFAACKKHNYDRLSRLLELSHLYKSFPALWWLSHTYPFNLKRLTFKQRNSFHMVLKSRKYQNIFGTIYRDLLWMKAERPRELTAEQMVRLDHFRQTLLIVYDPTTWTRREYGKRMSKIPNVSIPDIVDIEVEEVEPEEYNLLAVPLRRSDSVPDRMARSSTPDSVRAGPRMTRSPTPESEIDMILAASNNNHEISLSWSERFFSCGGLGLFRRARRTMGRLVRGELFGCRRGRSVVPPPTPTNTSTNTYRRNALMHFDIDSSAMLYRNYVSRRRSPSPRSPSPRSASPRSASPRSALPLSARSRSPSPYDPLAGYTTSGSPPPRSRTRLRPGDTAALSTSSASRPLLVASRGNSPASSGKSSASRSKSSASRGKSSASRGKSSASRGKSSASSGKSSASRGKSSAFHSKSPVFRSISPASRGKSSASCGKSSASCGKSSASCGKSSASCGKSTSRGKSSASQPKTGTSRKSSVGGPLPDNVTAPRSRLSTRNPWANHPRRRYYLQTDTGPEERILQSAWPEVSDGSIEDTSKASTSTRGDGLKNILEKVRKERARARAREEAAKRQPVVLPPRERERTFPAPFYWHDPGSN